MDIYHKLTGEGGAAASAQKQAAIVEEALRQEMVVKLEEYQAVKERASRKVRDEEGNHYDIFYRGYGRGGREKELGEDFMEAYGDAMLDKDKHAEME